MKRTVCLVKFSDAQPVAGSQQVKESPQQPPNIGDMVERHQRTDQVIALGGRRVRQQIEGERMQMRQPGGSDLPVEHRQHSRRAVGRRDPPQISGRQRRRGRSSSGALAGGVVVLAVVIVPSKG